MTCTNESLLLKKTRLKENKAYIVENIVYTLLILYPIFVQYALIGAFSIGHALIICNSLIVIISRKHLFLNKIILILGGYYVFHSIIFILVSPNYFDYLITLKKIADIIFALYIITVFSRTINNPQKFYMIYKKAGIICLIFIYYQSITYYVLGRSYFLGIIPYLKAYSVSYQSYFRPSSFFGEPQQFANFILPLLVFSLKNKEKFLSLLITIAIFLSTSSFGIISVIIIWSVETFKNIIIKKNLKFGIISLTLICILIASFFYLDDFSYARKKIININIKENERLYKGIDEYSYLQLKYKILGLGVGNLSNYLEYINRWSDLTVNIDGIRKPTEFSNTISYTLLSFGIPGLIVYISFLCNLFKNINKNYISLIILFTLNNLVGSAFFNPYFIFYVILAYSVSYDKKIIKIKI